MFTLLSILNDELLKGDFLIGAEGNTVKNGFLQYKYMPICLANGNDIDDNPIEVVGDCGVID